MLREEDISINLKCQDFESVDFLVNAEETEAVLLMESKKQGQKTYFLKINTE